MSGGPVMGFSYAIGKARLLGVNATDTKSITHHRHSHHRNHRPGSPTAKGGLKTQDNCQRPNDKGSLRRRRDFARQRWPCGQHKIAVWRLAPTAAPRIPCVNLPMAAPFGLGSRRGICVYHRRCGTTSSARRERPLVHIRTRICAGDPVPLKPATLLPSSPTICRSGILKWLTTKGPYAAAGTSPGSGGPAGNTKSRSGVV